MTIKHDHGNGKMTKAVNRDIKYIVIHYTAGVTSKAGTAANVINGYKVSSAEVSSDYVVDDDNVICYNGDIRNKYTWHCGGSKYSTKGGKYYKQCTNRNSIGIEVCSTNSTGKMTYANDKAYSFTDKAVELTAELVKQLMIEYNIPIERVIRHYDVTGKLCPGIIGWNEESGSEKEWERFRGMICPDNDKLYYVQVGAFRSKDNAEKYLAEAKKIYPNAFIKVL